jgi:multiple sugar transport system ATP-binding protein
VLPKVGGLFEIGIRPEYLMLASPADAPIRAKVLDIEPLGLRSVLTVKNEDAEMRLVIDASTAANCAPGDTVGIAVADDGLLAFDAVSGLRLN